MLATWPLARSCKRGWLLASLCENTDFYFFRLFSARLKHNVSISFLLLARTKRMKLNKHTSFTETIQCIVPIVFLC